jgi:hypothetical protein
MATSGTTTFSVTRNDIITSALRVLGVIEIGAQPDAATIENASLVLNMMMKDWQTDGIKLWTVKELTLPIVAGQLSYNIGPDNSNDLVTDKPLKLIQCFLRNIGVTPPIDIPMTIISQKEYNDLGSKQSTGVTNSVYYWPYVNYGTITLFLDPDSFTATNYQLHMTVQRPIQDITGANQTFDFPSEWYQALRWGLASELAPEYGLDQKAALITQRSEQYKQRLMAWDVENASTFFQPDIRSMNVKFR